MVGSGTISKPHRGWNPDTALTTNPALEEQGVMADSQTTAQVEYRPIEGFPGYRVGDDGSVWSCWKRNGRNRRLLCNEWVKMNPSPDGDGYLGVNLFRDGKPYRRKVHLLVLITFAGPRPDGLEACHNDGILSHCQLSNLRWDTHSSNIRDRLKHGTDCRGEKSGNAKLTENAVRQIKSDLRNQTPKKSIAARYGVSPSCVSAIAAGKIWAWLKESA